MSGKIKFYTDEHVPLAVVGGLLRRGVDVLTTQKTKKLGASDMEHLILAKSQGKVILTQQDDNFLRLPLFIISASRADSFNVVKIKGKKKYLFDKMELGSHFYH